MLALSLSVLTACDRGSSTAGAKQVHEARGEIREIAADRRTAVIRHEEIPGYMPRMTMELNVRQPTELNGLAAGDLITFRLLANDETHWIDTIRKVGRAEPKGGTGGAPATVASTIATHGWLDVPELKPGDRLPEVTLLDEDDQPLTLEQFRGQAVAFTFFFTRCPLPDFCPRMNRNFAEARRLLTSDPNAPTNWMLLAISFDPAFDQPQMLRAHANIYRGEDKDRWRFAVADLPTLRRLAPPLDLQITHEGGTISHNLRTVVLDPEGRIARQFDGNRWTAAELALAVKEAARLETSSGSLPPRSP